MSLAAPDRDGRLGFRIYRVRGLGCMWAGGVGGGGGGLDV